jgi:hypothetical protein
VFAYGNAELNVEQRQQVYLIACQNSFEGGPAVFLARALLDLDDMDDSGNCTLRNYGKDQESQSLVIFPNPTNGIVSIQIPQYKDLEQYLILVYALDGRLLYSKNIASNTTQYNLDLSKFTDGFYNVVLSNLNGQIVSKSKLIVSK